MITDRVRMGAYREALEQAVRPGCRVADIGTGTGIFAIIACQLGARRVYAIEPTVSIDVARQVAAENGVADRIEFIPELSTRITLPEPIDVVVADVGGVLPFYEQAIPSLIDARERLLAESGLSIPARDTLRAALVETRKPYPYDGAALSDPRLGVDMSAATRFAANSWTRDKLSEEELLTDPQSWTTLDYATVTSADAHGRLTASVTREGTANAVCVWFDRELIDGIGFSNAPGEPGRIYGQALLPLETPVEVDTGDDVTVHIEARLVGGDYAWRWDTRITAANGGGGPKAAFEQSTVRSAPVSISRLRRREAGHRPELGEDGEINSFVLSLMDGATPLSDIAEQLTGRFPERFAEPNDALARVAQLSEKYSR